MPTLKALEFSFPSQPEWNPEVTFRHYRYTRLSEDSTPCHLSKPNTNSLGAQEINAFCRSYIGTYRPDYLLSYTLQQACQVSRIAGVTHAIDFFHMQVHMLNRIKLIPCRISSRRKQKRKGLCRLARDIAARHTRIAPTSSTQCNNKVIGNVL